MTREEDKSFVYFILSYWLFNLVCWRYEYDEVKDKQTVLDINTIKKNIPISSYVNKLLILNKKF